MIFFSIIYSTVTVFFRIIVNSVESLLMQWKFEIKYILYWFYKKPFLTSCESEILKLSKEYFIKLQITLWLNILHTIFYMRQRGVTNVWNVN